MPSITFDYPFDPTGTQASNKITGEKQVLSPPAWKDYHFIIPKMAPFFRDSIKLRKLPSGDPLVEGVDYIATHLFHDASLAVGKPVYGSITFYDKEFDGVIEITEYQTIGGEWTIDSDTATEVLVNNSINPRITTWEQVVETPREFPVIDHQWHLDDMVGMSEIEAAILRISQVLLATGDPEVALDDHLMRTDNPHETTKAHVGLGNVDNFVTADVDTAKAGDSNTHFMTPRRTKQTIEALAHTYTDSHAEKVDNPHKVTKAQVGLSSVQNYPVATQTEAEAGASNQLYMTPIRTKQAIEALALAPLQDHLDDEDNPHRVTKEHVGLKEVQNYPVATTEQAEAGDSNEVYMTALRTREAIVKIANQSAGAHSERDDNPHNVTMEQLGGYTQLQINQLLDDLNGSVVAKDTNAFGGKTAEEWIADLDGTGSTEALIRTLSERFSQATIQMDSIEAPTFETPRNPLVVADVVAGYHNYAALYGDGDVVFNISSDDYVDFGGDEMIGINTIGIGETAIYVSFKNGDLKAYGARSWTPPSDLGGRTIESLNVAQDFVVAKMSDNTLLAWGDTTKASLWSPLNGPLGESVSSVTTGDTNNGIVFYRNRSARAFGHVNFVTNVNVILDEAGYNLSDGAIGVDKLLVRYTSGKLRAWSITDPNGAASFAELTLPEHLQTADIISGRGEVFGIVNTTGYFYLWGDNAPDIDTEAAGMIDILSVGTYALVARDVKNDPDIPYHELRFAP